MKRVILTLDETLADFEIQDWIDNVFSIQYPDIKAEIYRGCGEICKGNKNLTKTELPHNNTSEGEKSL